MLEKRVMKTTESEHPELFRARVADLPGPGRRTPVLRAPGRQRHAGAGRVGADCSWSACGGVRAEPVAYAELPLAQHAFDVLASLRCQATTSAVADFLEAARAAAGPVEGLDDLSRA